jgi:hypothetical protein
MQKPNLYLFLRAIDEVFPPDDRIGLKIGWPGMADTTNVAGSRVLDRNWLH